MPIYSYKCVECKEITDMLFSNYKESENSEVACEKCGCRETGKTLEGTTVSFTTGHRAAREYVTGRMQSREEKKAELKRDYLVEEATPLRGKTFEDTYDEIKSQGNAVREQMELQREKNVKRSEEKLKIWKEGAAKRAPQKTQEIIERRAKEEQAKNKIVMGNTKPKENKKK